MLSDVRKNNIDLNNILDAINALPDSGGAELAVTLNDDGTQNLIISDDGSVLDIISLTADADATEEDVVEGKVFYARGVRRVGTGELKPSSSVIFGDGSDAGATIATATTWEARVEDTGFIEKNFKTLTVTETGSITAGNRNAGMIIRVQGDCTIAGSIINQMSPKTILDSDGIDFSAKYPLSMMNSVCGKGGNGGTGSYRTTSSSSHTPAYGGTGMNGRLYGGGWSGGGGGAGWATSTSSSGYRGGSVVDVTTATTTQLFYGSSNAAGINGGGGAGASGTGASGAGSNASSHNGACGNYGGGVIILLVGGNLTITGMINCSGGKGGNGSEYLNGTSYMSGGSGGGAGGGAIFICHKGELSNTGTLNVNGGAAGTVSSNGYNNKPTAGTAGTMGYTVVKTYEQYLNEDVA